MTLCMKYENDLQVPTLCKSDFKTSKRQGAMYPVKREGYRLGTSSYTTPNVPNLRANRRTGIGNNAIVRNNFEAAPVASRAMRIVPFEKLQLQTLQEQGIKVALGDKTIEKIVNIQVDDPTDVEWIAERNRRKASGESDEQLKNKPPLGRPQRKIKKSTLLEQKNMAFEDKLEQLTTAVNTGFGSSNADRAKVVSELALLVDRVRSLVSLTRDQIDMIIEITEKVQFPKDWRSVASSRYLTKQEFQANKGMLFLYILNKAQNKNKPIQVGNQLNDLTVLTNRWSGEREDFVLDLDTLRFASPQTFGFGALATTLPMPVPVPAVSTTTTTTTTTTSGSPTPI